MSPGQSAFEGYVAWITYHLLRDESVYAIQGDFRERFPGVPDGTWDDALAAAFRGINAAASAFGADLTSTVGSHLDPPPLTPVPVAARARVKGVKASGQEEWRIIDLTVRSDEDMAALYVAAIMAGERLMGRYEERLTEVDILPPLYAIGY